MGRDTKLAIVVAVAFVAAGVWYITAGGKVGSDAAGPVSADSAGDVKLAEGPAGEQDGSTAEPTGSAAPAKPDIPRVHKPEPAKVDRPSGGSAKARTEVGTARPSARTPTPGRAVRPEPSRRGTGAMASPSPHRGPGTVSPAARPGSATPRTSTRPAGSSTPSADTASDDADLVLARARVGTQQTPAPVVVAPTRRSPASSDEEVGVMKPNDIKPDEAGTTADRATPRRRPTAASPAARGTATPPKPAYTEYVIQSGDTFSALAVREYGHARHAGRIIDANPGVDPRRLQVGMTIKLPAPEEAKTSSGTATASTSAQPQPPAASPTRTVPAVPPARAYTVKAGEGWFSLAQKFLGDANRWPELYELNKERVPADINLLRAGTVIELPNQAKKAN